MTEEDVQNGLKEADDLEKTLQTWYFNNATETRVGPKGTPFKIIPPRNMLSALEALADTLIKNGSSFNDLYSAVLRLKICNMVWKHKKIINMSAQEIRNAKDNLDDDWKQVISKYSDIQVVEAKQEAVQTRKSPSLPVPSEDKSKVLKADPSKFAPIERNDDFFALFPETIEDLDE